MTQENAGTVNLFNCYFENNYSTTRGAAVYTRTNQLNIVGSHFADNTALEWVGCRDGIFAFLFDMLRLSLTLQSIGCGNFLCQGSKSLRRKVNICQKYWIG